MKKVGKKKRPMVTPRQRVEWVAVGIDTSTYSISGAMCAKQHGVISEVRTHVVRWEKGTDYFDRMRGAASGADFMHELMGPNVAAECNEVFIAMEEPVSFGHLQRSASQSVKQQIQINGSLMGSLLKWGWENIYEIQANQWRKIVAEDLGITTHKSKYSNQEFLPLPKGWNVLADAVGKFRSKQWVKQFHPEWDHDWPDLISHGTRGVIAKPEESKAKSFQPDDRYDALPIMAWMVREIERARA
jgi:hypothetical protein